MATILRHFLVLLAVGSYTSSLIVTTGFSTKRSGGSSITRLPHLAKGSLGRKNSVATNLELIHLRGGDSDRANDQDGVGTKKTSPLAMAALSPALIGPILSFGKIYASWIAARPIMTKSITAGVIFGLSDYTAQKIEKSIPSFKRTLSSLLVGLIYFGPAAHAWYEWIFRILPGTTLASTMCKAGLGQLLFGPSFTMIFFGVSLLQEGTFSLGSWWQKIKSDLLGVWIAGLWYWPIVDFISFSCIKPDFIPLFVNFCSFVWTIYLSFVANRRTPKEA